MHGTGEAAISPAINSLVKYYGQPQRPSHHTPGRLRGEGAPLYIQTRGPGLPVYLKITVFVGPPWVSFMRILRSACHLTALASVRHSVVEPTVVRVFTS